MMNIIKVAIVSGIGCSGRVAGYLHLDSFHTPTDAPFPSPPDSSWPIRVRRWWVYSGDGDLFAIGGNHLIHAAGATWISRSFAVK
jgi:2-oxoglutarate ferredoxin oxidoreductase subunit beta